MGFGESDSESDNDSVHSSDSDIGDESDEEYIEVAFQKLQTIKFPPKENTEKVKENKLCGIGILIGQIVSIDTGDAAYQGIVHKFGKDKILLEDVMVDSDAGLIMYENLCFPRNEIKEFQFLWGRHDPQGDIAALDEEMQKLMNPKSDELWQCEDPNCYEYNDISNTECLNCKLQKNYKDVEPRCIGAGPHGGWIWGQFAVAEERKKKVSTTNVGHDTLRKAVLKKGATNVSINPFDWL